MPINFLDPIPTLLPPPFETKALSASSLMIPAKAKFAEI